MPTWSPLCWLLCTPPAAADFDDAAAGGSRKRLADCGAVPSGSHNQVWIACLRAQQAFQGSNNFNCCFVQQQLPLE